MFSERNLHALTDSFIWRHQGQYLTQESWTLPQSVQVSRNIVLHFGQTSQPETTSAAHPGHSPVKGSSGGAGLSSSMQIK